MSLPQRIKEKQRELDSFQEMEQLSSNLATQLEQLENKLETLSDGSEAVALIVSNWTNIIKAASLASMSLPNFTPEDFENKEDPPLPETLVRLRIEEEQ